jgi:hypothetical protein
LILVEDMEHQHSSWVHLNFYFCFWLNEVSSLTNVLVTFWFLLDTCCGVYASCLVLFFGLIVVSKWNIHNHNNKHLIHDIFM